LRLAKGNENFQEDKTLLTIPREFFPFKAYPNRQELGYIVSVSAVLIEKYRSIEKYPGLGSGKL